MLLVDYDNDLCVRVRARCVHVSTGHGRRHRRRRCRHNASKFRTESTTLAIKPKTFIMAIKS